MAYTVGAVARITRLSVRALHHYDEIGLVRPSRRTRAGYRLYTDSDLDRLQQVLLLRALGLRLDDIAETLNRPDFDRRAALVSQRASLMERLDRTRAMLDLVDRSIRAMDGEVTMNSEEKFEAFGGHDPEEHESEVTSRWGATPEYAESRRRTKQYSPADWKAQRAEADALTEAFADAMRRGLSPSDHEAIAVAERHRLHIDRWFYPCAHAMHSRLGRMYVEDPRFAANYERHGEGLAQFVCDAIAANESAQAAH